MLLDTGEEEKGLDLLQGLIGEEIDERSELPVQFNSFLVLIRFWYNKNDLKKAEYYFRRCLLFLHKYRTNNEDDFQELISESPEWNHWQNLFDNNGNDPENTPVSKEKTAKEIYEEKLARKKSPFYSDMRLNINRKITNPVIPDYEKLVLIDSREKIELWTPLEIEYTCGRISLDFLPNDRNLPIYSEKLKKQIDLLAMESSSRYQWLEFHAVAENRSRTSYYLFHYIGFPDVLRNSKIKKIDHYGGYGFACDPKKLKKYPIFQLPFNNCVYVTSAIRDFIEKEKMKGFIFIPPECNTFDYYLDRFDIEKHPEKYQTYR